MILFLINHTECIKDLKRFAKSSYCSKTLDSFAQDYVKPVGYDSRRHSPDKTYGSGVDEDEELMEQVG